MGMLILIREHRFNFSILVLLLLTFCKDSILSTKLFCDTALKYNHSHLNMNDKNERLISSP